MYPGKCLGLVLSLSLRYGIYSVSFSIQPPLYSLSTVVIPRSVDDTIAIDASVSLPMNIQYMHECTYHFRYIEPIVPFPISMQPLYSISSDPSVRWRCNRRLCLSFNEQTYIHVHISIVLQMFREQFHHDNAPSHYLRKGDAHVEF